jgi:hypothetical protein
MDNRKSQRAAEERLRQQRIKHAKKFAAAYRPLIAVHEGLTASDLEDGLLVVDGETIYATAFQEVRGFARFAEMSVADFKTMPFADLRGKLGCVSLVMPTDAKERGAYELLSFLKGIASRHDFSLTTMFGPVPTAQCLESFWQYALSMCDARGEA